jgi:sarcosine oxidase, subunit gamma
MAEPSASLHSGFALRELPFLTQLGVRGAHPALPRTNAVVRWTAGVEADLLGLGPDEWLAVAAPGLADRLEADLRDGLAGAAGSIVDVSAQRTTLVLSGPAVREVLAHGCALDLRPGVFEVGGCAQTMLAHAQVIIWHTAPDEFRVLVRPSFAGYLVSWILDAAQ